METEKTNQLYRKYLANTLTLAERKQWEDLLANVASEEAIQLCMDADYEGLSEQELLNLPDKNKQEILGNIFAHPRLFKRPLWIKYTVATAAAIAVVLGIWFYSTYDTNNRLTDSSQYLNAALDLPPGKNTATLTLANGNTILLSDEKTGVILDANKLTYNDGTLVDPTLGTNTKLQSPKELTVSTPRSGTYQVILPDSSKVWLNAASSIHFPSSFKKSKKRVIILEGEAYFEIIKDKNKPFIVKSTDQEITVLGTHFNVNAYPDEKVVRTSLLEGSVKISTSIDPDAVTILKPSEQAINSGGIVNVKQVDVNEVISWKNGDFIFNDEPLESIMRKIARWYDVEVIYDANVRKNITLGGYVSRSRNISAILERMERTGKVKFKIEGRKIQVLN